MRKFDLQLPNTEAELRREIVELREALEVAATDMDGLAVCDFVDERVYKYLKEFAAKIDAVLEKTK